MCVCVGGGGGGGGGGSVGSWDGKALLDASQSAATFGVHCSDFSVVTQLLLCTLHFQVKAQHLDCDVGFLAHELKVMDEQTARNRVFFVSAKEVLQLRGSQQNANQGRRKGWREEEGIGREERKRGRGEREGGGRGGEGRVGGGGRRCLHSHVDCSQLPLSPQVWQMGTRLV